MKVRVDASQRTFLGLCACGHRYLALSRVRALERLAEHEERSHAGEHHARDALAHYRARHADTPSDSARV